MELRQLRVFIKAAETLNFSEGAKALFMTQSSFSQNIKQLEEELKIQLFYRNSHEVTLTEAGKELLPYARSTIQQSDNCVNLMNDLNNLQCGTLDIGVTHSFSQISVVTIAEFMKAYPAIKLNVIYKTMGELFDLLMQHKLDFVLSYKPLCSLPQIESHILFEDHLSVIVNQNHPLAKERKVKLDDLHKFPLALPAKGLQARNALDRILEENKVTLDTRVELNQVTPLLRMVRKYQIATVLSSTAVNLDPDLKSIPIDSPHCEMEGSFHMLKDAYRKASAKEFIRMLMDTDEVRQLRGKWLL